MGRAVPVLGRTAPTPGPTGPLMGRSGPLMGPTCPHRGPSRRVAGPTASNLRDRAPGEGRRSPFQGQRFRLKRRTCPDRDPWRRNPATRLHSPGSTATVAAKELKAPWSLSDRDSLHDSPLLLTWGATDTNRLAPRPGCGCRSRESLLPAIFAMVPPLRIAWHLASAPGPRRCAS
jgi:hypothetical protein